MEPSRLSQRSLPMSGLQSQGSLTPYTTPETPRYGTQRQEVQQPQSPRRIFATTTTNETLRTSNRASAGNQAPVTTDEVTEASDDVLETARALSQLRQSGQAQAAAAASQQADVAPPQHHKKIDVRAIHSYAQHQANRLIKFDYMDLRCENNPQIHLGDVGLNRIMKVSKSLPIGGEAGYFMIQTPTGDVNRAGQKKRCVSQVCIPVNATKSIFRAIDQLLKAGARGEIHEAYQRFGEDWFFLRHRREMTDSVEVCSNQPVVGESGHLSRFNVNRESLMYMLHHIMQAYPGLVRSSSVRNMQIAQGQREHDRPVSLDQMKQWFYNQRSNENVRLMRLHSSRSSSSIDG